VSTPFTPKSDLLLSEVEPAGDSLSLDELIDLVHDDKLGDPDDGALELLIDSPTY
jgi:hypothetical protein